MFSVDFITVIFSYVATQCAIFANIAIALWSKSERKSAKTIFLAGAGFEPGSTKVSTEGALAHWATQDTWDSYYVSES